MALVVNRPQTECYVYAQAVNTGSTLGTAFGIAPAAGIVKRVGANYSSSIASTVTIAVQVGTSSTDICSSTFTYASNTASTTGVTFDLAELGSSGKLGGITCADGDVITFSPTVGGGSCTGTYFAVIHIRG